MGVPKKRKTKSGTRRRRSHQALSRTHLAKCRQCGAKVLPHEACRECGYYPTARKVSPDTVQEKTETATKSEQSKQI